MPEHDSHYIADVNALLYDLTLKACRKQVLVFSGELKNKMLSMGVSKAKTAEIIKEAFKGYTTMDTFKTECSKVMYDMLEAYLRPSRRQRDNIGRLLVEYGITRAYKRQILCADESEKETAAREKFVKGVIARPLLRYFLVSVRGALDAVDEFKTKPVLFGLENEAMAERTRELAEIVKKYTVQYKYGKQSTNWGALYDDPDCKRLACDTLGEILETIASMGPQRYFKIIGNIQSNNKFPTQRTAMERLFELNDVKQLVAALTRGHKKLVEDLAA